jgi:hypothetical protein
VACNVLVRTGRVGKESDDPGRRRRPRASH